MFLRFDGIENARDLGGMVRTDGARIRQGALLRSGHLGRASEADVARLADMGVCLVVDMRDRHEREREPDRAVPGARNVWLPPAPDLPAIIPMKAETPAQVRQVFHEFYRYLALHPDAIEAYNGFFRELLSAQGKPVLWHCTQGKDRTGVGAMLLLSALGFDWDAIMEEYLLTNQFAAGQLEQMRLARAGEEQLAVMAEVFQVFETNGTYWSDCVRIEYGSVESYLEMALNLDPEDMEKLQESYLQ